MEWMNMKRIFLIFTLVINLLVLSGCSQFEKATVDNFFMIVENDELYGLVDLNGDIVVPIQHTSLYYCGSYYYGNISEIADIYQQIAQDIIEASYYEQKQTTEDHVSLHNH